MQSANMQSNINIYLKINNLSLDPQYGGGKENHETTDSIVSARTKDCSRIKTGCNIFCGRDHWFDDLVGDKYFSSEKP